jgi:hypothetical protein
MSAKVTFARHRRRPVAMPGNAKVNPEVFRGFTCDQLRGAGREKKKIAVM